MAYRKKTLRQLNPTARKLGKAIGKLQSALNDFKKIIDDVNLQEAEIKRLTLALQYMTKEEKLKDKAF